MKPYNPIMSEKEAAHLLGERFRMLRKGQELTQAEVSRRTGIDRSNIARLEKGAYGALPHTRTILRLAAALEVEPSIIFSVLDSGHAASQGC